jgi:predicted ATP-grasp superfamily ATP-dependent carboligase
VINKDITNQFTEVVDDLILASENDTKLAESIRWIDLQSQKNGISFYEMVYIVADKQLTKKRAQQWLMNKRDQNSNKHHCLLII